MSTTVALAHRPPSPHAAELDLELDQDLMALLELLGRDDETGTPTRPSTRSLPRPSLRRSGARLLTWAQDSSRRAAAWGAVPAAAPTCCAAPARPAARIEGAP